MKSVAISHFPRVVIENHQKWLFNPVLKKRYKNRPEERVRLKWVEHLLHQTNWKRTRIGFETPVPLQYRERQLRADLLLYTDNMKPHVLIECKSESVSLDVATAEQAARYNRTIGAPYIILTNGLVDVCYHVQKGKANPAEYPFQKIGLTAARDFKYWAERGFCSHEAVPVLKRWLDDALNDFWNGEAEQHLRYLAFKESYLPIPMKHYYRVFGMGDESKLAITFVGYGKSATCLVAVLNRKGMNEGVIVINLHSMEEGSEDSARCFTGQKEIVSDARNHLWNDFSGFESNQIKNLPENLMKFFY